MIDPSEIEEAGGFEAFLVSEINRMKNHIMTIPEGTVREIYVEKIDSYEQLLELQKNRGHS